MIPYDKRKGKIWYNNQLVDWGDVKLHVLSHGLHYASCVFEGERVYDGDIFKMNVTISKDDFIANTAKGGKIIENIDINCYKSSNITKKEKVLLDNYANILSNIHKNYYNNCISISWDLMFHNNNIYLLEGNIGPNGCGPFLSNKCIDKYYNKIEKFLIHNKQ